MITTNDRGMKTIEFGAGDILIHNTKSGTEYVNGLCFNQQEPHAIGEITLEYCGRDFEEHAPDVHIVFNKRESIDVLIEMLQEIKEQMPTEGIALKSIGTTELA